LEIVKSIETNKITELAVVDEDNIALGLLEKVSIISFMEQQAKKD
jgi:Mg/Co/Ni transporter MgtE